MALESSSKFLSSQQHLFALPKACLDRFRFIMEAVLEYQTADNLTSMSHVTRVHPSITTNFLHFESSLAHASVEVDHLAVRFSLASSSICL